MRHFVDKVGWHAMEELERWNTSSVETIGVDCKQRRSEHEQTRLELRQTHGSACNAIWVRDVGENVFGFVDTATFALNCTYEKEGVDDERPDGRTHMSINEFCTSTSRSIDWGIVGRIRLAIDAVPS